MKTWFERFLDEQEQQDAAWRSLQRSEQRRLEACRAWELERLREMGEEEACRTYRTDSLSEAELLIEEYYQSIVELFNID